VGSFEIQVFVSLVVVLGAAFVALICDYLKGNNERLRERNEELQARAAEREMLETLLNRFQSQTLDAAMKAQQEALREFLARTGPGQRTLPQAGVTALPETLAVGESTRRTVAKRGAETGAVKELPSPVIKWPLPVIETPEREASPVESAEDAPAPRVAVELDRGSFDRRAADEIVPPPAGGALHPLAQEAATLLEATPPAPVASPLRVRIFQMPGAAAGEAEPVQDEPAPHPGPTLPPPELAVPAGYFEAQGLQNLLAAQGVFQGLVVCIRVVGNGDLAPRECPEFARLLSSVARTVQALRRAEDFSCRSAESEFVLIYPRETGPVAQRLIGRIKERLYDLQLRSLGTFSARFIWGAAESASNTSLADLLRTARAKAQDFLKA
jgi:hypothetical protein